MSTNSASFIPVAGHGWLRGFGNLLGSELARWWKTPMWWIVCLVYTILTVWMVRPWGWMNESGAVHNYSIVPCLFQAVGVVTIMQGALVSDRKQGTASWVLSKPATRPAFVLSKLIANSLGVMTTMVLLSGAILYAAWLIQGTVPPEPIPFLKTLGIIFICQLRYLTLTLMLGALLDSQMAILGIGAGLLVLSKKLLTWFPMLRYTLPWYLMSAGDLSLRMTGVLPLMLGEPIERYVPKIVVPGIEPYLPTILVLAVECLLFAGIALWRFSREEL
jgi:ABC-type transport system involved in multi-copper enzyme maturation permease subunit